MYRQRTAVPAVLVAAVITAAGCTQHKAPVLPDDTPVSTATTTSAVPPGTALPAPEALADVLYRLADPAVPGAEKVALIEGATPDDAGTVDRFATALKDGAYLPLTFAVSDIGWSDRKPGNATANVKITTNKPDAGEFTFPMEFAAHPDGWRLSEQTADLLLAFGAARSGVTQSPTPAP